MCSLVISLTTSMFYLLIVYIFFARQDHN